ncbi:MAG: hypothetical protein ACM3QS_14080 [Bacteroidota bacterium]
MDTTQTLQSEIVHLQEPGVQVTEDTARPAEQVLAEQSEQENRPIVFIP